MKNILVVLCSLFVALGAAHADEKTADSKKSEKAKKAEKKKAEKKDDRNAAQKAESSIGDWANRNKVWMHSSKKSEK